LKSDEIKSQVREFVKANFLFDDRRVLGDDESLLGSGTVDSTGILELISFLEQNFNVKFKDQDLVADNFDSISKIAIFVAGKNKSPE
jgi:acyl carrier protein